MRRLLCAIVTHLLWTGEALQSRTLTEAEALEQPPHEEKEMKPGMPQLQAISIDIQLHSKRLKDSLGKLSGRKWALFTILFVMILLPWLSDVYHTIEDHFRANMEETTKLQTVRFTQELLNDKVYNRDGPESDGYNKGTKSNLDEKVLMDINGETKLQMKHAKTVKADGKRDTSVDQAFEIDESLAFNDKYVLWCSALWIIPKFLIFAIPLFVTVIPYYLLAKAYQGFMDAPTDVVRRNKFLFIFFIEILGRALLFIPYAIGRIALLCDYFFYYLFGLFFLLVLSEDGWPGYYKSRAVMGPYENGPQTRWSDLMVASLGQVARNGLFECCKTFAGTYLLLPWLKYWVNTNPFVYPLEERFVQQISSSMDDLGLEKATDAARKIISRSKQGENVKHFEHTWDFIPHYPYPPPGRRWANGIQHVGKYFELHVHATHAHVEAQGSYEQFVLSNSIALPVYRVMLWYNNPYHFFTGFVEASISTGLPSQKDKLHGGEHPMWLVTAPSPLLSGRDSATGVGMIDAFFDYWLPDFVDGVRYIVLAEDEGDDMKTKMMTVDERTHQRVEQILLNHKEVKSKDGLSEVAKKRGKATTVEKFEKAGLYKRKRCKSEGCPYSTTGVDFDFLYCCNKCKKGEDHGKWCDKMLFDTTVCPPCPEELPKETREPAALKETNN